MTFSIRASKDGEDCCVHKWTYAGSVLVLCCQRHRGPVVVVGDENAGCAPPQFEDGAADAATPYPTNHNS